MVTCRPQRIVSLNGVKEIVREQFRSRYAGEQRVGEVTVWSRYAGPTDVTSRGLQESMIRPACSGCNTWTKSPSKHRRYALIMLKNAVIGVSGIATKEFIATVAGKQVGDSMLGSQLSTIVGWHYR